MILLAISAADWTAVAAAGTALAAGVTAWMAWMTRKMAAHAETQASTAADALEGSQRPIVVTSARTARLPSWNTDIEARTIREQDGKYIVPVQNIGAGAALNVVGVLFWNLVGEEDGEQYDVTTTTCVSPHPLQLASGAHGELEFRPLTQEPISASEALVRLWYKSASDGSYWTADRLSTEDPGYRSVTGRGDLPTDLKEDGAVPDFLAERLVQLRREALKKRFGRPTRDDSHEAQDAEDSP